LFPKELKTLKDPIPGKNATGAAKDLIEFGIRAKVACLRSELSAEDRVALDQKLSEFNKEHPDPADQLRFRTETMKRLEGEHIRRVRVDSTVPLITKAIDEVPARSFANETELLEALKNYFQKNVPEPVRDSPPRYQFNITTGEITFPYENQFGYMNIKIGPLNGYKILKALIKPEKKAGAIGIGAIGSCVLTEGIIDEKTCKYILEATRARLKKILSSDPSLIREIEGKGPA